MANILVVDDSALIRMKIRSMLEAEGLKVFEAFNQRQVIRDAFSKEVSLQDIDLVLLDLYLKDEDGLKILEFLIDHYPDIPVIMVTVEGKRDVVMQAIELGAKDYILKPFDKRSLLDRVYSFIPGQREVEKEKLREDEEERFRKEISSLKVNLSLEINRSLRSRLPVSIVKLDITEYIAENEINSLKETLTNEIRDIDRVFAVSEQSFILILPLTGNKGTKIVTDRLKKKLKESIKNVENNIKIDTLTFPNDLCDNPDFKKINTYHDEILKKLRLC